MGFSNNSKIFLHPQQSSQAFSEDLMIINKEDSDTHQNEAPSYCGLHSFHAGVMSRIYQKPSWSVHYEENRKVQPLIFLATQDRGFTKHLKPLPKTK
jgi:hypothetical protein